MELATARKRLVARREELRSHRDMSRGSREAVTLDQQSVGRLSRMDAMQLQAMAQAQERQRAVELQRVDRALAMIEAEPESYGVCTECGADIPDRRLEIDPAAARCVRCA